MNHLLVKKKFRDVDSYSALRKTGALFGEQKRIFRPSRVNLNPPSKKGKGTLFISFSYDLAFISLIAIATPVAPTQT